MKVALGDTLVLGWNCCCAATGLTSSSFKLLSQRRRLSIILLFLFFALCCRLSIIALLLTPCSIIKQNRAGPFNVLTHFLKPFYSPFLHQFSPDPLDSAQPLSLKEPHNKHIIITLHSPLHCAADRSSSSITYICISKDCFIRNADVFRLPLRHFRLQNSTRNTVPNRKQPQRTSGDALSLCVHPTLF